MDLLGDIYEAWVLSCNDEEQLMDFAAVHGLQDSPVVRQRLFDLRNPGLGRGTIDNQSTGAIANQRSSVIDQAEIDDLLEAILLDDERNQSTGPIANQVSSVIDQAEIDDLMEAILLDDERETLAESRQVEIDDLIEAILTDDEREAMAQSRMKNDPWFQQGAGSPQPGPSTARDMYTMRLQRTRTFAKNVATEKTYKVKISEDHQGRRLSQIRDDLYRMFEHILDQVQGEGNDLGRVMIHHDGLHDAIVIPLQPWDTLNVETIMEAIERVLNSQQNLTVEESFYIIVGCIELPKGNSRRRITSLSGPNNSLLLKKSVVTIDNRDQMCLARSIGVTWAKLHRCMPEEWKALTANRQKRSNIDIILEHKKVPDHFYKHLTHKKRDEQRQLAVAISKLAGVPLDRPASLNDIPAFEKALNVNVMVVSARLGNKFVTSPVTNEQPCVYVYHIAGCHFHAITSVTGFFSSNFFCQSCLKHYDHHEEHQCETTCIVCKSQQCPKSDNYVTCPDCNMACRSEMCYVRHKQRSSSIRGRNKGHEALSQCEKWFKCTKCWKTLDTEKRKKDDHVCGEYFCSSCEQFVQEPHLCFLRTTKARKDNKPKFIFFDFECSQDDVCVCETGFSPDEHQTCQHCKTSWCGKAVHRPNFVVAHTVCPECLENNVTPDAKCSACGSRCDRCDKADGTDPCPETCGLRETIFEGQNTLEHFGKWLFSPHHKDFKVIAHNMKGYDGYFLLEYLIDNSMRPQKIIYNGSKIMYMSVEKDLHIKVMDSLNFLPMKLAKLPETFGLEEITKGYFPHYFNTSANQQYIGPYPNPTFYGVDFMKSDEREKFFFWYETLKNRTFDFRKEILAYCRSDVDILRRACLQFRQLLMEVTGKEINVDGSQSKKQWIGAVDPFDSVTIASVCMNVYRQKFLEEQWSVKLDGEDGKPAKTIDQNLFVLEGDKWIPDDELEKQVREMRFISSPIAKIPPGGYKEQYSKSSIEWLEWMSYRQGVRIQHALNGGEKKLEGTRYKLDGFCETTNTAYEYNGCAFHGCPDCFQDPEKTKHPMTKQSMKELHALTIKKKKYIENLGMKYVSIWEHEYLKQLKDDKAMKEYVDQVDVSDRLQPRDSFFGGRTNASQLYYKVSEGESIKYYDFTSLYPFVNKYCKYPLGHPVIITEDFQDIKHYFGIAKVKVLPPRGLYHPVLPFRSNGKLKFPLCRTCADKEQQAECKCPPRDRAITGTWCTPEINTAIRVGYKIEKVYEVYHWPESTEFDAKTGEGGLFAKYINTFLKIKQEASGWPQWCKTENDKQTYIEQYYEKEGIRLDYNNIKKNPGLRALAKLMLNSFWGKFGQRLNMRQTSFFHKTETEKFFQTLGDQTKDIHNFHIVADDIIHLEWAYKDDCVPEDNKTNIYIATFTTCYARLKLYGVLELLNRRVLYYDTDSVIYVSKPGQYELPLGDYLGDLTDELGAGQYIVEFVSGGPKNYCYKTNTGKEKCAVRGFTLHFTNAGLINFDSVKALVTESHPTTITVTNPNKICRDKKKRKIYNREERKTYQMVYTKRRRLNDYDTVPYGY